MTTVQVNVVAHEIAHSWTGNLVSNETWQDFWLNEGADTARRTADDSAHLPCWRACGWLQAGPCSWSAGSWAS